MVETIPKAFEEFKLIIEKRTPSANNLYHTNRQGYRFMTREAKALKHQIIEMTKEQLAKQGFDRGMWDYRLIRVRTQIHEKWWNQNNTVKKKDVANREKFLIDAVMEGMGIDDRYIWEHILTKVDDYEEKAVITISFYYP